MKKSLWILIVIVIVAVAIYLNLNGAKTSLTGNGTAADGTSEETIGAAETPSEGANVLTGMYGLAGVEWVFTEKTPGDGFHAPVTTARVQPIGVTRPDGRAIDVSTWRLGDEQGTCSKIDRPADEKAGALSYAQCWWAGGGDQFRAVRDGNNLRIDVRVVDEGETAPATFKQLMVIDLTSIVR